ncbi:hypothetical protein CASFOL_031732 [Castilleja foliolosa]|uniref:Uncharacterized protein n=1 Tax=Castilleja foliolosa TaxID=1961234 RepID=A0ABD3C647_9LAMI
MTIRSALAQRLHLPNRTHRSGDSGGSFNGRDNGGSKSGISGGAIAGIVISILVVGAIVVFSLKEPVEVVEVEAVEVEAGKKKRRKGPRKAQANPPARQTSTSTADAIPESTTSTGFLMLEPPPTQMPESTSVPEWTCEEILETVRELPDVDPERAASIEGWRAFFLEHDVENPVDSVSATFTQIIGGDISIELERY